MKKIAYIALIGLLSGCATQYQSSGFSGGFTDTELAPGYYRITFRGNGVTSGERVSDFALLRASELMINRQCKNFQVLNSKDSVNTSYYATPQTTTTNVSAYRYGNYINGSATSVSSGGGVEAVNRARSTIEVRCVNQEPDPSMNIFDAIFINQKLKQKYKID
ncbi:TPA: hypothetical protein ACGA4J_001321 [Acinetobacter baumannii]